MQRRKGSGSRAEIPAVGRKERKGAKVQRRKGRRSRAEIKKVSGDSPCSMAGAGPNEGSSNPRAALMTLCRLHLQTGHGPILREDSHRRYLGELAMPSSPRCCGVRSSVIDWHLLQGRLVKPPRSKTRHDRWTRGDRSRLDATPRVALVQKPWLERVRGWLGFVQGGSP